MGKGIEDIDCGIEPFGQAFISTLRSIELLSFLFKHGENAPRRITVLELGAEWVDKKVLFCASVIRFQGIIENLLEVGG